MWNEKKKKDQLEQLIHWTGLIKALCDGHKESLIQEHGKEQKGNAGREATEKTLVPEIRIRSGQRLKQIISYKSLCKKKQNQKNSWYNNVEKEEEGRAEDNTQSKPGDMKKNQLRILAARAILPLFSKTVHQKTHQYSKAAFKAETQINSLKRNYYCSARAFQRLFCLNC